MPAPKPTDGLPCAVGIGLRAAHMRQARRGQLACAWFEVHSENHFAKGGADLAALVEVRQHYPLSLHGVGLSLGSADPLDPHHLAALTRLVEMVEPAAVSEHLCWSSIGRRFYNDLLPLPHSREALDLVVRKVDQVQLALKRPLLIENISSYLRLLPDEMAEWDFLAELVRQTDCQLLIDVNNIHVSATNLGFDPHAFLHGIPQGAVAEIHLAGFEESDGLLIDTHSRPVCDAVWNLYEEALGRFGPVPTLIEWDQDIPEFAVLQQEAARAQDRLDLIKGTFRHACVA